MFTIRAVRSSMRSPRPHKSSSNARQAECAPASAHAQSSARSSAGGGGATPEQQARQALDNTDAAALLQVLAGVDEATFRTILACVLAKVLAPLYNSLGL